MLHFRYRADLHRDFEKVASAYGSHYTWDMKVKLMGRPGKQGAEMANQMMKLPLTTEEFINQIQKHKDELFGTAKLLPGTNILLFI